MEAHACTVRSAWKYVTAGYSTNAKEYFTGVRNKKKKSTSGWLKNPRQKIKESEDILKSNPNYIDYKTNSKVWGKIPKLKPEWEIARSNLRKYTGGEKGTIPLTDRQKEIQIRSEANRERRNIESDIKREQKRIKENKWKKDIQEVTKDLWTEDKVPISNQKLLPPSKSTILSNKSLSNEVKIVTDNSSKLKNESKIVRKSQDKNPIIKNKNWGRKIGYGVLGAAILGGAYTVNRLRKTRSDKNKKRGKYKNN